jgi:hypothetical protein
MESMGRPRSYPDEFLERAVRLVREWRAERGLSDGGITVVAALEMAIWGRRHSVTGLVHHSFSEYVGAGSRAA